VGYAPLIIKILRAPESGRVFFMAIHGEGTSSFIMVLEQH